MTAGCRRGRLSGPANSRRWNPSPADDGGPKTFDPSDPVSHQPDGRSIAAGARHYQGIRVHSARPECPDSVLGLNFASSGCIHVQSAADLTTSRKRYRGLGTHNRPRYQRIDGMPSGSEIFRARRLSISAWRGTGAFAPVAGLEKIE